MVKVKDDHQLFFIWPNNANLQTEPINHELLASELETSRKRQSHCISITHRRNNVFDDIYRLIIPEITKFDSEKLSKPFLHQLEILIWCLSYQVFIVCQILNTNTKVCNLYPVPLINYISILYNIARPRGYSRNDYISKYPKHSLD